MQWSEVLEQRRSRLVGADPDQGRGPSWPTS